MPAKTYWMSRPRWPAAVCWFACMDVGAPQAGVAP